MTASPGLLADAHRAVQLGWPLLGVCPNSAHTYGFHMPTPAAGDYSLDGALNQPVGAYCCAMDVTTTTALARRYVHSMFDRWDAGVQPPDMAEFIGSVNGRTVLYASWKKPGRVELYRGQGHDHWLHAGKFRALTRRDGRWLDPRGPYMGDLTGEYDPPDTADEGDDMTPDQARQLAALDARVENVEKYLNSLFSGKPATLDAGGGKTVTMPSPLTAMEQRVLTAVKARTSP